MPSRQCPSAFVVCSARSLKSDIVAVDALISSLPTAPLLQRAQSRCVHPTSRTPFARARRHGRPSLCSVVRSAVRYLSRGDLSHGHGTAYNVGGAPLPLRPLGTASAVPSWVSACYLRLHPFRSLPVSFPLQHMSSLLCMYGVAMPHVNLTGMYDMHATDDGIAEHHALLRRSREGRRVNDAHISN